MKLYLLRHGHAPSAAESGVPRDCERPLSAQGREDARRMARHLAGLGCRPAVILHSPLLRAQQTALEAASVLKPPQGLEAFAPLANELGPDELAEELARRCAGLAEVLAVGHQPQLGELVSHLSRAKTALRPAGAAALELKAEAPASFLWSCNAEDLPG